MSNNNEIENKPNVLGFRLNIFRDKQNYNQDINTNKQKQKL
jgi:hypothetical protein